MCIQLRRPLASTQQQPTLQTDHHQQRVGTLRTVAQTAQSTPQRRAKCLPGNIKSAHAALDAVYAQAGSLRQARSYYPNI
jgi:hypothetical protein